MRPLLLITCLFCSSLIAQHQFSIYAGRVFKHNPDIMFEVNSPSLSVAYSHYLGRTSQDHTWALNALIDLPIVKNLSTVSPVISANLEWQKPFHIQPKVSILHQAGIAYFFNSYHPELNPNQNAIGSSLNIHFALGLNVQISNQLQVKLVGRHYSNGSNQLPNLGINSISAGITLGVGMDSTSDSMEQSKPGNYHSSIQFGIAGGGQERLFPGGPKKLILEAYTYWNIPKWNNLLIGIDAVYLQNKSVFNDLYFQGLEPNDYWDVGVLIGKRFLAQKFALNAGLGYYLYQSTLPNPPIFIRLQLEYPVLLNDYINIHAISRLRAHYFRANTFTVGLAFGLN